MPTDFALSTPTKPDVFRPATPPGRPVTPSARALSTSPLDRPVTPPEQPRKLDVDEPAVEQLFVGEEPVVEQLFDARPEATIDIEEELQNWNPELERYALDATACAELETKNEDLSNDSKSDEAPLSTSPIGSPILKVSNSKVPVVPMLALSSPAPRNSSGSFHGKVSELVQAYEVKSTASDHSSPCKTSRQQVDAPVSRITPCQPTTRPALAVKKLEDGRFFARELVPDVDETHEDVVDIDTGVPMPSDQIDMNKYLSLNAEITTSTVEPLGDPEQSSFCSCTSLPLQSSTSPLRQRTMSGTSQHECTEEQEILTPSNSPRKVSSPRHATSQSGRRSGHRLSTASSCSIASVTPRFATNSFVNSVFEEALHNATAVLPRPGNPATCQKEEEEASEVRIESENRGAISVNYKKAGVVHESMVAYTIKSCSRSLSPRSPTKSKLQSYRAHCEYPDQYFLPLHPRKLITHIQDGRVCIAIMFPDPGGIFKKTSEACKAVGSSTKVAIGETKKLAQTPVGKSALTGAAVLGVAGGGGGALAGSGVGALAGIVMAPLTFGLSIPVGVCLGCSVGAGMGVTAGSAIGAASGGVLGYVRDRRREDRVDVLVK